MPSYQTTQIPIHLQKYVVDQAYEKYTWRDHAVWRFVMHRNIAFLKEHAHDSYISGLAQTGISIEKIPTLDDMNQILNQIGWSAVCVDGFIPPEAFMEFQANKILVVAADIRHFKQIEYTPAPDILHEAAGHAPIISNPSYSQYLQEFGKLGVKAFSSATDHELYQAIRTLSELKCRQSEQSPEIVECEKRIAELEANKGNPSEMALLRNLHWWTVEYGLVGEMENPKIYGAGLLSSLAESNSVVNPAIKKIRYSLEAMHYSFDITHVQPQLFVSSDFDQLTNVLAAFSSQMAFKKGGAEAILKAIDSKHEAVCELSSGIQIVGVFTEVILSGADIV
ncbi:MAG: aromatic amino acid hydroxylase, partial [Bacteroidales bacterium]|nr:aromatic amino acid hydroxylase [Bacteroidales bacterium]